MKFKSVLSTLVVSTLIVGGASAYANEITYNPGQDKLDGHISMNRNLADTVGGEEWDESEGWGEGNDWFDTNYDESYPSFEEMTMGLEEGLSEKDLAEAKALYEEMKTAYENHDELLEQFDALIGIEDFGGYDDDGYDDFDGEEEMKEIAMYTINGDAIRLAEDKEYAALNDQLTDEQKANHKKIWELVKKLVPDNYESRIGMFEISTDGVDGILASVAPIDDGNTKYIFHIDSKDAIDQDGTMNQGELERTIIHEFGHIMTLNAEQMNAKDKNTYQTMEGTLAKDSYLNQFYQKFWKPIESEWNEEDPYSFYDENASQFVNDYAATNPAEDIAESFTYFVVQDKPTGNTLKDEKLKFFYQFDELVKMRAEMRTELSNDAFTIDN